MTRTGSAIILFFLAQSLCPPAVPAGTMTRYLKLFPQGFPRLVSIVQGTPFVICVSSPGSVAAIDKNPGTVAASFPSSEERFAVSPDGLTLAVVTSSASVTFYSLPSWEPVRNLEIDSPRLVEYSPDGRFLAVARGTDDIYIYQLPEWERVHALHAGEEDAEQVKEMAFSPDGRFFAAASGNRTGRAWDAAEWRKLGDFKAPSSSVKFTYDGKYLSAPAAVYELSPKKLRKTAVPEGEENLVDAKLMKSRNMLVTAENGSLLLFEEATRAPAGKLVSFPGDITGFDLSSDEKFLVAASTPAGTLYITALAAVSEQYNLYVEDGTELYARGKYEEALRKFIAAKEVLDTPGINERIAGAGCRVSEMNSDAAAAEGRYEAAIAEMEAVLLCNPTEEGKLKLNGLTVKKESLKFSGLLEKARELEKKYEYGTAAAKLQEALLVKADPKAAARAKKLARQEPLAAKYRNEFSLGSRALKKRDFGAAVRHFTKAIKFINTPEAVKGLEEAQDNFRR